VLGLGLGVETRGGRATATPEARGALDRCVTDAGAPADLRDTAQKMLDSLR
jgi:hypothetical protein